MISEQHSRTVLLVGEEKFEKLRNAHVLIVGLGGVGGHASEQICRAGIGKMTLIDADVVQESNLNRQIIALKSSIGKKKTEVLTERLKDINPLLEITTLKEFIADENINEILSLHVPDYVVDAIDTLSPKVSLIKACFSKNIPIVSSMGAGGRINPEKVHIADIEETYNCRLARMLRKRLHRAGIRSGFKAVFSSEKVISESIIEEESRNKKTNLGTVSYMPAIFGMFCASVVIQDILDSTSEKGGK